MTLVSRSLISLLCALPAGLALPLYVAPAAAQANFQGETVSIQIGYGPGGGYDTYGRALARHYGRFIPGYNVKGSEVPGGIFFVIGPDKQLDAWEEYLEEVEGEETRLYRLYGRDFWMP